MAWTEEDLADHYSRLKARHDPDNLAIAEAEPKELRESLIQEECAKFMEADGWRYLKTDPVSDRSRGKGFGEIGMADALFLRPNAIPSWQRRPASGDVLWVEFKCGGNKARKDQQSWHLKERARGFATWIANEDFTATVEGFREHYAKSGLMRRSKWW